ncbi:MAG: pyruvate dehydrogenase (acetyl-transferring), homodimeric type [Acidimicrobiales bacterium]|nr:pyruvate dehydrogenase (acetyl-transferring), homodimeric type [Acidimicrobiales bacterium]RZV48045.1 MAG: pyruvate dehydrogenase (acetyl-transferring), homodimeric type [Acidimicrobiales bacterium]
MADNYSQQLPDIDPDETQEWLDSLDAIAASSGKPRARYIMSKLLARSHETQIGTPPAVWTPYVNTIPTEDQPFFPGDEDIERRIRAYIRWNAAAMVVRANAAADGIGGHLSSYASSSTLYEVGFNHFWRGKDDGLPGDHIYMQGHAAPGIYARAFLEGRLTEENLDHFRMEIGGKGLSSYPHPRLMPEFWEFPTVSMGLGPINSIYHARFARYLRQRHIDDTSASKVWCFIGDGETDEPETLGAISLAGRSGLGNLIWVVNCNLQRLDGPVRGNDKIIQELEGSFRGAGWNVIKVVWGTKWDELLARDVDGVLLNKMNTTVDGEFQRYAVEDGSYIRQHFFGPDPRLRKLVDHLSDDELRQLPRGGHDYLKMHAAYAAAVAETERPTVILAKTIKGWTLGEGFEARNSTHQLKKMTKSQLIDMRARLQLEEHISDEDLEDGLPPYFKPAEESEEMQYLKRQRQQLGGSLPKRVATNRRPMTLPSESIFDDLDKGSGGREVSTTMAFTALLRSMMRDQEFGERVVPIVPDEARTFGMDSLFREFEIYAPFGQLYEPVDHELLLSYSEDTDGQILEEGITEAGSLSSFIAAGTSYANYGVPMVPFFTFYSMFGFQRVGDLIWSAADSRARGFLLGATAGRSTLMGEGLQHQDGHSHLAASTVPSCESYDPAFAYELGTIIKDGLRRMYGQPGAGDDIFYYITIYNENYDMPARPDHVSDEDILSGLYLYEAGPEKTHEAAILFSGALQGPAREAQAELAERWDVGADLWSATSYQRLRVDALETERRNRLHPAEEPVLTHVERSLTDVGPVVAVSDFMKIVPDQISRWVPGCFTSLGTDGFGRSDTRDALRTFFEIDMPNIVVAVLECLAKDGTIERSVVAEAIDHYGVHADAPDPAHQH